MPAPEKFTRFIDQHADDFIQRLKEAVAIPRCVAPLLVFIVRCEFILFEKREW